MGNKADNNKNLGEEKEKTEREIVLARLEVLLPDICFASGSDFKSYSRDMIIEEIKKNSEIGKDFIKTEMEFLRALKNGNLTKRLVEAS